MLHLSGMAEIQSTLHSWIVF